MLKWTVQDLLRHQQAPLHFEETLDLEANLKARDPEILAVTPIKVAGDISADGGDLIVTVTLAGQMTIPSTRSLTPVDWPLNFSFSEVYAAPNTDTEYDEGQLVLELPEEELDLQAAVADHILLSIPMQVLTPEEEAGAPMPSGQDWSVISEATEAAEKAETPNPAFAKLKQLLDDDQK